MPTMDERRTMIAKIADLPNKIEEAVKGLNDTQLDTPYRDGGWTVRQVTHHLADSHMNAFLRFKWVINEQNTRIKGYNQDVWAMSPEYAMPVGPSLALIRNLHTRWVVLLNTLTTDDQWIRTADHPEKGVVTLDWLLQIYSGHGEKHCSQIWGLRKKMNW